LVTLLNILKILYLEEECYNVCNTENFSQYCIVIQCPLISRISVTCTDVKILAKETHVYTAIASFLKEEEEQNITKLQCAFLQIYFLLITSPLNIYCLMPLHKISRTPHF